MADHDRSAAGATVSRRSLREARLHAQEPSPLVPQEELSRRALRGATSVAPDRRIPISAWDVGYFLVELGVYSGVSVAALRLANGSWSSLQPLGLVAAVVAIFAMATVWAIWAAEHAARRPRAQWLRGLLEFGWMLVGVGGWLVAELPAFGALLAGATSFLAVRRLYDEGH